MTNFRSWRSFWAFAHSVRYERRYHLTSETKAFLKAVEGSAGKRMKVIPEGAYLWRAQLGAATVDIPIPGTDEVIEEDYPLPKDRMKPLPGRAIEGRATPRVSPSCI